VKVVAECTNRGGTIVSTFESKATRKVAILLFSETSKWCTGSRTEPAAMNVRTAFVMFLSDNKKEENDGKHNDFHTKRGGIH
jgi:hypothetical protein